MVDGALQRWVQALGLLVDDRAVDVGGSQARALFDSEFTELEGLRGLEHLYQLVT